MKRKIRDYAFEVKEVSDKGEFSGYGSVNDVVDVYRERVAPGAFSKSLEKWKAKNRLPPVLWQHMSSMPLGPYTMMREDQKGLYVEGTLLIDKVQKAGEAHALMKSGAISGLSIGFNTIVEEFDKKENIITLKEVELWEVSIVTFPANDAARVEAVKSICIGGNLPTVRDFEDYLREAGFSKSHAAAIATHGLGKLLREAEVKGAVDVKSIVDAVFKQPIITAEEIFK